MSDCCMGIVARMQSRARRSIASITIRTSAIYAPSVAGGPKASMVPAAEVAVMAGPPASMVPAAEATVAVGVAMAVGVAVAAVGVAGAALGATAATMAVAAGGALTAEVVAASVASPKPSTRPPLTWQKRAIAISE
jgi:hypothetical protein